MSYPLSSGPSLMDPFRPMRSEATAEECIVIHGEIPKGFYRAGPPGSGWSSRTVAPTSGIAGCARRGRTRLGRGTSSSLDRSLWPSTAFIKIGAHHE
jgi:hypothetical protein